MSFNAVFFLHSHGTQTHTDTRTHQQKRDYIEMNLNPYGNKFHTIEKCMLLYLSVGLIRFKHSKFKRRIIVLFFHMKNMRRTQQHKIKKIVIFVLYATWCPCKKQSVCAISHWIQNSKWLKYVLRSKNLVKP